MKSWEETIAFIRSDKSFDQLVHDAYLDEDLDKNSERFYVSEEYQETKKLLEHYTDLEGRLLDLGAGNGISSIAFARDGMKVTSLEPDESATVGSGAISIQKEARGLDQLKVITAYAEDAKLKENSFDIVYARQSMHHANDLKKFVSEAYRILKPGGIMMTVRDHVISEGELNTFLKAHPLHHYYGGENAFTLAQYKAVFEDSGFKIIRVLKPYDTPINYAPFTSQELKNRMKKHTFGLSSDLLFKFYLRLLNVRSRNVAGRLYSFICQKEG